MDNLAREGQRRGEKTVGTFRLGLRAGDVVFWHSLLAHSRSLRINPALSRKSVMSHYIVRTTNLYTCEQFMLDDPADLAAFPPHPTDLHDVDGRGLYALSAFCDAARWRGDCSCARGGVALEEGLRRRLRWALGRRR
jgi:hypothetical protein